MSNPQTLKFTRRNLPHWLVVERAYFVTIRLKNTLPADVLEQLRAEGAKQSDKENQRKHEFRMIERILDACKENRLLDNPDVAALIMESLTWFKKKGWVIYAATILSTHIHLLMKNTSGRGEALLNDIARFKNYTAREANKILGTSGHFWAREAFDHWIRNPDEFEKTVRYIANNPVKAGRVSEWIQWPWTIIHEDVRFCLE